MNNRVFYLKYRSQKVSELDLVHIRENLEKILKSKKIPHALLFSGPRGTGKTSAARIFAKAVNCQTKRKTYEPCNRCSICQSITEGSSLDLIEIDAASNRGIDDVRELRSKIKLSPSQCQYKVYIIDEVHMLTNEAFNALLKTLEEPPEHAIFILCTTVPEKLPDTIISRCLRFNFKKAKTEEIVRSLKRVVKGEKLNVGKEVLKEIAKSADGSFRDAHKILDQLAMEKEKITLARTKELLGKIEATAPEKLLQLLVDRDLKGALLEIDRIVSLGADLFRYCQDILDRLRLGLLFQSGLTEVSSPKETASFNIVELAKLIRLFSQAANDLKTNPIPQLSLELVAVEWLKAKELDKEELAKDGMKTVKKSLPISIKRNPQNNQKNSQLLKKIKDHWPDILAGVKPLNHSVEALLRACRPTSLKGDVLIIEVFYEFHKERLETDKCRRIVEEVASEVMNQPLKLRCVLGQRKAPVSSEPSQEKAEESIVQVAEDIFGTRAN